MSPTITNSWFVCLRRSVNPHLRLFLFPYAGSGPMIFRRWPDVLGSSIEAHFAQLPGRAMRHNEPLEPVIGPVIHGMISAVLPLLDRPYAFFGHSMGALIAFELCREIRRRGLPPPLRLFASGRCAPQCPDRGPFDVNLGNDEFIEKLRELKGTPAEILDDPDVIRRLLPVLRADFNLCANYDYRDEPALQCPITALGASDDSIVDREGLEAWKRQTKAGFSLRMFSGNHFFVHSAESEIQQLVAHDLLAAIVGSRSGR
jgi:medium-chain acyl-[acyl-carrier-protein] hydrolase